MNSIRVSGRVAAISAMAMLLLGLVLVAPASAADAVSVNPTTGPAGTLVTVSGTFVLPVTSVTFGGATGTIVGTPTTTTVVAVVPPAAVTGAVVVDDAGADEPTNPTFTVTALGAPTITSFTPVCGPATTSVVITGTNLIGVNFDTGFVRFGGVAGTPTIVTNTSVTVPVPAGPAGAVPITVRSDAAAGESGATATGPFNFLVQAVCALTITTISPASGPVGTSVTITGTNFPLSTTCPVTFSSNLTVVGTTNASGTQITATVPSGTVTGPVLVSCSTGAATTNFTVAAGAPTITSFTPTSGPVGTVVTITGTNFTGATAVRFNNVAATFTVNSATQITATVPTGATTGKITVTNPAGTGTSATNFTVTGAGAEHPRTVSFRLSGLQARGTVSVTDGFDDCASTVPVMLQVRKSGGWNTLGRLSTNKSGQYRGFLPDNPGTYRMRVGNFTLLTGATCGADSSPSRTIKG